MRISILTPTNRPEFMAWATWNVNRQHYPEGGLEWVIASEDPVCFEVPLRTSVVPVVTLHRPGVNVPALRNALVEHASGDAIVWFDDDDWQHPRRVLALAEMLSSPRLPYLIGQRQLDVVGFRSGQFVRLEDGRVSPYVYKGQNPPFPVAVTTIVRREIALAFPFDEQHPYGSDTRWIRQITEDPDVEVFSIKPTVYNWTQFWLVHGRNMWGRKGLKYAEPLDYVRRRIDAESWGQTDDELARLQGQIVHMPFAALV